MADDDMPEKPKTSDLRSSSDIRRRTPVRVARMSVAAWMVVGEGKCSAIVTQYGIENLSYRHHAAVDRPFRYNDGSPKSVCSIAHKHDNAFPPQTLQFAQSDAGDVISGADDH